MKDAFLIASAIISLAAVIPYLRDIVKGSTKPNIVSWLTWTLLAWIATAAEISAHEYRAAFFTGVAGLGTALVVMFGLRRGFVKYARFDIVCQIAAVVGIILWQLFNSPLIGVLASVTIDFIGALPTIRHAWRHPHEETWQTFVIAGVGGFIAIFGMTAYNATSLSYALYIVAINIILASTVLYRLKS